MRQRARWRQVGFAYILSSAPFQKHIELRQFIHYYVGRRFLSPPLVVVDKIVAHIPIAGVFAAHGEFNETSVTACSVAIDRSGPAFR